MHFAAERPEQTAARRPSCRWSWSSASTLDNARAITTNQHAPRVAISIATRTRPTLLHDRRRDNMSLDEVGQIATHTEDAISSEDYAICPGVFSVGADSGSQPCAWLARHRGCKARRASPISLPTTSRPDIDRRGTQVALKHCRAILHQQGAERRDVAILKRVSSALCDHPLPKDH
jgi:hypothetical protein